MNRHAALLALLLAVPAAALAEDFTVNPEAGNSGFSAVFDAALGERINAVSSAVGCEVTFDEKTGLASGRCSVPLTSIKVDADDTKSGHFHDWATNKKSEPEGLQPSRRSSRGVKLGTLAPGEAGPVHRRDPLHRLRPRPRRRRQGEGRPARPLLFPPGAYGEKKTIRIRATIAGFDRDAYRIGPGYTDGWLARVQSLAKVVAVKGTVELSLFAKAK